MTDYVIKPLDANTWDAFARLVERHNGVFGGCWCTWFHTFHATAALRGAVDLIAQAGGGIVEGYPHDTGGQKVSVLYNGTRSLYEQAGFSYVRPKGKRNCVMRRVVP